MIRNEVPVGYEERADGVTVRIGGEIDHHSAVAVRTGIDAYLAGKQPKKVYLELSDVNFMDSSGLGLIMGRFALVKRYGGELAVLDPSPAVIKIIKLAGMDRLIPLRKTKEEKHGKQN